MTPPLPSPAASASLGASRPAAWKLVKPLADRAVAAVGLLFASPLIALLALAVKLRLGSPVLFRQTRIGLGGRPFAFLKLRTMANTRDQGGTLLPDAERLTRLGRWLRASSLDELPQLWNILKGDMSLVGPRPLLPEYLPRYSPEQQRRHAVKPGITGLAQVRGRNGLSWDEKFRLDVWYVDHLSASLDLRILAATVGAVLRATGIRSQNHATMPPFLGEQRDTRPEAES